VSLLLTISTSQQLHKLPRDVLQLILKQAWFDSSHEFSKVLFSLAMNTKSGAASTILGKHAEHKTTQIYGAPV
jgi:hypothetical protein